MNIVKRKACLIPYIKRSGCIEIYLSHRSKDAKQYPEFWSFWGGAIENEETPEEAMLREIKEELEWEPSKYEFFGIFYDSMPNEKHLYFTEVNENFEKEIIIHESQGGEFFNIQEIKDHSMIIQEDKKAIFDLFCKLN